MLCLFISADCPLCGISKPEEKLDAHMRICQNANEAQRQVYLLVPGIELTTFVKYCRLFYDTT
jgi:hypothetical protein